MLFAAAMSLFLMQSAPASAASCSEAQAPCDYTLTMGDRQAYVHVPATYFRHRAANETVALLLDLHGRNTNGRDQADFQRSVSGQRGESDTRGFIAVWPQSTYQGADGNTESWNGFTCCGPAYSGTDDTGFLQQVIDQMKQDYAIDDARVYVTGESNGGSMTIRMGCFVADVKAIAPVSAAVYANASEEQLNCPRTDMPVMEFRGQEDTLVNYDGGQFQAASVALQRWLHVNACSDPDQPTQLPQQPVGSDGAYEQVGEDCTVRTSLVTLPDSPHLPYTKNSGVDIAGYIWTHVFEQSPPAG